MRRLVVILMLTAAVLLLGSCAADFGDHHAMAGQTIALTFSDGTTKTFVVPAQHKYVVRILGDNISVADYSPPTSDAFATIYDIRNVPIRLVEIH